MTIATASQSGQSLPAKRSNVQAFELEFDDEDDENRETPTCNLATGDSMIMEDRLGEDYSSRRGTPL